MTLEKDPNKDGLEDLKSRIEVARPRLAEERISSAKQIANRNLMPRITFDSRKRSTLGTVLDPLGGPKRAPGAAK